MANVHTLSSHFLYAAATPLNYRKISPFPSPQKRVDLPKEEPKFEAPFLGFTRTAEIWNSRAGMIGIIMVFIVEFILNKGLLQLIGVDVGKGLDIPL